MYEVIWLIKIFAGSVLVQLRKYLCCQVCLSGDDDKQPVKHVACDRVIFFKKEQDMFFFQKSSFSSTLCQFLAKKSKKVSVY